MKIKFDKEKGTETISGFVKTTKDLGKKVATSTKDNITNLVEKSKSISTARKLKKLNPLFPEQYNSDSFNLPNMIMIVDDAVRRDIELCNGAIGWTSKDTGAEILYLYDEAVEFSKLSFVPTVTCDTLYYVDSFDRNRFIRVDCIFGKAHEERIAELKHIAYSLGAKSCSIEISESIADSNTSSKSASIKEVFKNTTSTETSNQGFSSSGSNRRSGRVEITFEGNETPQKPTLKWFSHDDNINRLIEMRCNATNSIKCETLELSGSSSATMSQKTACTIDSTIGKIGGATGQISMNTQAAKEHHSKLLFNIEF